MPTQLIFLRAVNVAGHGLVSMPTLRDCLIGAGFTDVRTLLQTGNVVLQSDGPTGPELESHLQAEFANRLKLETEVMVRSAVQWKAVVAGNPFPDMAKSDPSHLTVMLTRKPVTAANAAALRAAVTATGGPESVGLHRGQIYVTYPAGIGRSKLTGKLIERALAQPTTGRNWNTVLKLAAMIYQ